MNRILLFETDEAVAARLLVALRSEGKVESQLVDSMPVARRKLTEQRYDLAIIPADDANRKAQGLRALQPDLPIIVLLSDLDNDSILVDAGRFQGMLNLSSLEEELPAVLAQVLWLQQEQTDIFHEVSKIGLSVNREKLGDICREINLDGIVQQVILSRANDVVSNGWINDDKRAREVAARITDTWDGGARATQIQFMELEDSPEPIVLYTRVAGSYLLTLVARSAAPISQLREQADKLAIELLGSSGRRLSTRRSNSEQPMSSGPETDQQPLTYAFVLWPVEPIPDSLQNVVDQAVHRVVDENGCDLKYLRIQADYLHVLVGCPPSRPSSWFVHLLKEGVEGEIGDRYGISPALWASGYYAAKAHHPLSTAELKLLRANS